MANYLLAFDLGTTSTKAVVVDREGTIFARANREYPTFYDRPGWAEQNPLDWWEAVCALSRELLSTKNISARDIAGVVFSGAMLGLVPVDARGQLVRARSLIFADARSVQPAEEFLKHFGHQRFYDITGGAQTPAIYPLFKIKWLEQNEPEVYRQAAKFLQAKTYIIHRLTGELVTDHSDASQTGVFDLQTLNWSREILDAAKIAIARFPEVRRSVDVVGKITRQAAADTTLLEGTPVVAGGGDILCACAGAGVVEPGAFYFYIGSAAWCGTATARPVRDFNSRILGLAHIVPGAYAPHLTMYNGANCEQWIREAAFAGAHSDVAAGSAELYRRIETEAATTPPGASGLFFLPYLRGGDPPLLDPDARGALVGLHMGHTRAHLYRAVLEGVAFQLRMILEVFTPPPRGEAAGEDGPAIGHDPRIPRVPIAPRALEPSPQPSPVPGEGAVTRKVRLIGGGAESPLWRQILADVLQRELAIPRVVREAGCLGAAMAGGVGIGMFKDFTEARAMTAIRETVRPRPEHAEAYERMYQVFRQGYAGLKDIYRQLAKFPG